MKPSEAFCGAIDREDEFDAQDAVALAAGEAPVPQHLQVCTLLGVTRVNLHLSTSSSTGFVRKSKRC